MSQPLKKSMVVGLLAVLPTLLSTQFVYAKPAQTNADIEAQIRQLVGQMTLKEKISMVTGNDPQTNPIPRLHIPAIVMNDGPMGVRSGHSTAFPAGIAIGATFDVEKAALEGEAIADEARLKNINMMLGPCVNISRQPFGGRNFESFGEDPLLSAVLASSYIKGMQSRNVIATVKHFAVNDQEYQRKSMSSAVSTRALFEMHFPMFKAAVDAGVLSVMASYNKINGVWATENQWLLTNVLKDMWGFKGFVVSDWTSTHSTTGVADAGTDIEMPYAEMWGAKLEKAVQAGQVKQAVIDNKITRILRVMFKIGLMGPKHDDLPNALGPESKQHQKLAQTLAEESMVLLKNEMQILPIASSVNSIALIGPHAGHLRTGGGGSSRVIPFEAISPLQAIKEAMPGVKINYAEGSTIEGDLGQEITSAVFKNGLITADYFRSIESFAKRPFTTRKEAAIELSNDPKLDDRFGVRFHGDLIAPQTGEYVFSVENSHTTRLFIDGKKLVDVTATSDTNIIETSVSLIKGQPHKFVLETGRGDDDTETSLRVGLRMVNKHALADAVAAAKASQVAILFLGAGNEYESEGRDRDSLDLPSDQLAILNAVTAVNPNTVVIMTGGGVFTMPWLAKVRGLVAAWYPGSEGGRALARLIKGDVNFTGKLPISYIKSWADASAYTGSAATYPGIKGVVKYAEDIFVGYRFMDKKGVEPRWPFGFGLSYTTFAIRALKVDAASLSANDPRVTVTFDVTNTGDRDGAEVAQVYVGERGSSVPRPVRELKGFSRVELKAGETKTVSVNLDKSAFAYFDVPSMSWKVNAHVFDISVGSSSRDLAVQATVGLQ